ncbi:hypothetical protein HPP92_024336 [Vanilla planifolia]|uniref:Uncharacterized protein n=1 Tax=Vanilla planifolia TaxID=51239 RepID=A0A835UCV0_VANPL|nr:hypothetical protein HPP92_024336 [Vanilla planifolia]
MAPSPLPPPPSPSSSSHIPRSTDVVASDNKSRSTSSVPDEPFLEPRSKAKRRKRNGSSILTFGAVTRAHHLAPPSLSNDQLAGVECPGVETARHYGELSVSLRYSGVPILLEPFICWRPSSPPSRLSAGSVAGSHSTTGKFGSCEVGSILSGP